MSLSELDCSWVGLLFLSQNKTAHFSQWLFAQKIGTPTQVSDWGSSNCHALQQILACLPPAAINRARLVSKHWRSTCDSSVQELAPGDKTQAGHLLAIPSTFPNISLLNLTRVQNSSVDLSVLSALQQLSNLRRVCLRQVLLPPWFNQLSSLQCQLDIALADTSLTFEFTRLASSLPNLAHLLLSYPIDLTKGLISFSFFSRLQSLNIQAAILHTSPRHGRKLLSTALLDFPVEAIDHSSLKVIGTLTQLTSLRLIGVKHNLDAAGAAHLSRLQKLQHLAVYMSLCTGVSHLSAMTSLTYLCLKSPQLFVTDDSIDALRKMEGLHSLVLEGSVRTTRKEQSSPMIALHDRLNGLARLPSRLATLQFWGWLPPEAVDNLGTLTSLTRLTLWESEGVTPETIRSIATLRHLEYLDLSYNNLAGAEWGPVGQLTALTALHLHGCQQVTDATVRCLSTLTNLQWFDISHGVMKRKFYQDHLTEEGIWTIGVLTNLQDLNLTDLTNLTDHAVLGLSSLTRLTQICLVGADKLLHPVQNSGLIAMKNLRSLDLSRSLHIDLMDRSEFQALFASLTNLKQLRYGADNFAYTLASDEPEAVEIYPSDSGDQGHARLHMPV